MRGYTACPGKVDMDIKTLKEANPIEEVIQECGYPLARQEDGQLKCTNEPGLIVEPKTGRYYWNNRGESGDIIVWLRSRFGWSMPKALKYLQNRAGMPPEQRKHLAVTQWTAAQPCAVVDPPRAHVEPCKLEVWEISDWRVREALKLGWDFPEDGRGNGLEIYVERSGDPCRVLRACSWMPSMFIAYSGFSGDDNFCLWCFEDLPKWAELGDAFVSVALDGNYRFAHDDDEDDHGWNGIYCWRCVDKIKRWYRACDLIFAWRMEQVREEREACKDEDERQREEREKLEADGFRNESDRETAEFEHLWLLEEQKETGEDLAVFQGDKLSKGSLLPNTG